MNGRNQERDYPQRHWFIQVYKHHLKTNKIKLFIKLLLLTFI